MAGTEYERWSVSVDLAGTGHRPDKLGGYSPKAQATLLEFAGAVILALKPKSVTSGLALGWDQALASASAIVGVPFDAYIPFKGQEKKWPKPSKDYYFMLLAKARKVVTCSPGDYAAWKMQTRNERMVDQMKSDEGFMLALWDGSPGGTANCVRYANSVGVPIVNVWDKWAEWQSERNT
jgi:hypothetical protein